MAHVFAELMRVLPPEANVDVRALADDPAIPLQVTREKYLRHVGLNLTLDVLPRCQLELGFLRGNNGLAAGRSTDRHSTPHQPCSMDLADHDEVRRVREAFEDPDLPQRFLAVEVLRDDARREALSCC